jgi:hypothetical protein
MNPSKQNQKQRDDMVAGIVNEIRGNASVNYRIAKFEAGQLVYNRNTDEDGFISGVLPDGGVISYEVWIPKEFNTWKAGPLDFTLARARFNTIRQQAPRSSQNLTQQPAHTFASHRRLSCATL